MRSPYSTLGFIPLSFSFAVPFGSMSVQFRLHCNVMQPCLLYYYRNTKCMRAQFLIESVQSTSAFRAISLETIVERLKWSIVFKSVIIFSFLDPVMTHIIFWCSESPALYVLYDSCLNLRPSTALCLQFSDNVTLTALMNTN